MSLILDHVSHTYNPGTTFERTALYDINLTINDGDFIGLIGHTGSGKSTLIQHFNGLLKPTEGHIYYQGKDIHDKDYSLKKLRSEVGLVFQYPEYQLFETTVVEDVKFGPRNIGMDNLEADIRTYESLKQVGIGEDLYDVSPLELSGGQKRRVAIAGVLAMNPKILVLDEPTAGLDPKGRNEILDLIKKLADEQGITVVLVSHSMEDVTKYANRVIVMADARVRYDDLPARVFAQTSELEKIGLRAPQITYFMQDLQKAGIPVNSEVIRTKDAVEEIMNYFK